MLSLPPSHTSTALELVIRLPVEHLPDVTAMTITVNKAGIKKKA